MLHLQSTHTVFWYSFIFGESRRSKLASFTSCFVMYWIVWDTYSRLSNGTTLDTHFLILGTCECNLIWQKRVLADMIKEFVTTPDYCVLSAAAAAKSLQSCPTLCDPVDSSPPGSPVPWIIQARTLEWVAISLSNAWKWKVKVKLLSRVRLLVTPWTAAYQAPLSMGFSRQEYCVLSRWALSAFTYVLLSGRQKDIWYIWKRRRQCDLGASGWSDAATSQGIPTTTRNGKKHILSESLWQDWGPADTLILTNEIVVGLLTSRTSVSSVLSLSHVWIFAVRWTEAYQASLSIINSWSLFKLMSIKLVMPSNHFIPGHPLLLPSIFSSIRVFSNESVLCIR